MRLMREQKSQELLRTLRDNLDGGLDSGRMVQGFLEFLRVLLLILHGVQDANVLELPEDELLEVAKLKENFSSGEIHYLFETFRSLPNEFRFVADERILLEVTFLRALEEIQRPDIGQIIEKLADELYPERAAEQNPARDATGSKQPQDSEVARGNEPSSKTSHKTAEAPGEVEGDSGDEGSPVDEFVDMLKEVFDGREISSEERQNTQRLVKNMQGQSG
jgi:DNA polymerase III gamma/tau subunit